MCFLRARSLWREDGGFGILESTVALVIIFGVLLVLLRTMDSGVRVLLQTRHQAAASAFANELLERARSLEWDNVGLAETADGSTCPDQVGCYQTEFGLSFDGSNWEFEGNDMVFINPAGTFDPFLSFHVRQTRDQTVFDRFFFVTSVVDPADPSQELYRKLTAIVQWTAPSGFGDEVRHVTYVAPFEPPPPFLGGLAEFDGGSVSIFGTQAEGRAMVQGTSDWLDLLAARPDLTATVELPGAELNATTGLVSGGVAAASGMVGEIGWSDGTSYLVGPERFEKRADDDTGSAPGVNDPSTGPHAFAQWKLSDPKNLVGKEVTDAGADDNTDVTDAEAWTEHTTDALPWSDIDVDSAEAVKLGFVEYQGSGTLGHPYYDLLLCGGSCLDLASYEFMFLWYGDALGPALQYQGEIDRYEKDPTMRRVDVKNVVWNGERVYLGRDQAYETATADNEGDGDEDEQFRGWLRVDLPRIAVTLLSAGEVAPSYSWSGDLVVIWGWDPTTSDYIKLFEQSYDTITSQQTVSFGPVSHSLRVSGHPQLDYAVEATLTVNPAVVTEEFSGGNRSNVSIQAPSIVSGTFSYVVDDAKALQRLYDLDLAFDLGSMRASARYVDVSGS